MAQAAKADVKTSQVGLKPVESIVDELTRMREAITLRAYQLFEEAGSNSGRELSDWLRAEQELVLAPPIELRQTGGDLVLEVAVVGLDLKDLDVQVAPEDILVQSKRAKPTHESEDDTVYQSEFPRGKLFRAVNLPHPIDPTRVRARYRSGLLEITAPLAESTESVEA
jgi:HSP20 family protein